MRNPYVSPTGFEDSLILEFPDPLFNDFGGTSPIAVSSRFLVVTLNSVFKLSVIGCRVVLRALKVIVRLAHAEFSRDSRESTLQETLRAIPADLSTAQKAVSLDPESTDYACCPSCFALYPPKTHPPPSIPDPEDLSPTFLHEALPPSTYPTSWDRAQNPSLLYPEVCTFRETRNSPPCGARMLRLGDNPRPIRLFVYQKLVCWLGGLLCRPEIEALLDASQASAMTPNRGPIEDILQSEEIRNFLGPDGFPFLRVCGSEGRYLFSLFVDWFNPYGNRHGGASYSAGVIFMVCLNLPPALRYKRENMYLVGVIPGPKSPSLQQVNHFIEPLAADLRDLWFKGARFTRTALRREGRTALCAMVLLVCDLGAGRKVSGHASHSSTFFCSFCRLTKDRINDLDVASWPRRDSHTFRILAEAWRSCVDVKGRDAHFKKWGVRYSPLLILPYWQPTRYVVVDTMHNLFLGIFQRHCRRIFGMNIKAHFQEDSEDIHDLEAVTATELEKALQVAAASSSSAALKNSLNLRLLRAIYIERGLGPPAELTKLKLAEAIIQVSAWFSSKCTLCNNRRLSIQFRTTTLAMPVRGSMHTVHLRWVVNIRQ